MSKCIYDNFVDKCSDRKSRAFAGQKKKAAPQTSVEDATTHHRKRKYVSPPAAAKKKKQLGHVFHRTWCNEHPSCQR